MQEKVEYNLLKKHGITPKELSYTQPFYMLFRYHYNPDVGYVDYIQNLLHWMFYRKIKILLKTFGVHNESQRVHFHFHCVVQFPGKPLSNPLATIKRDIEVGNFCPSYSMYEQPLLIRPRCIGIQIKDRNPEDDIKVLGYPLKEYETYEEIPLAYNTYYTELDLENLRIEANSIFKHSKKIRIIKDKVERKSENIWVEINTILDKHNPSSPKGACRILLTYYREKKKRPPFPSHLAKLSELYCFKKNITDVEDILNTLFNY